MSQVKKKVSVVVLGDIGRSPRMQYHALSLARCKFDVELIGYSGSKPLPDIISNDNINITNLTPLPELRGPKILQYGLKTFWQTLTLFIILFMKRSDFVLCQNPPAIPTLLVCWVHCLLTRAKFIIDWHNYAYTIMALTHGENHLLVRIAKHFEFYFGAKAHANLCVTKAMKKDLLEKKIVAKVLYDRPADIFHPITDEDKHNFIKKISVQYSEFAAKKSQVNHSEINDNSQTILTESIGQNVLNRVPRPGVLFSSTSWTPDEDFQILLSALEDYDIASTSNNSLPKLICVITGKGPMKDDYIQLITKKKMKNVEMVTPWLESLDYPKMVASADLGVCLHTSSSGLDLPMKVVDMFGSGLPVCAFKYQCLNELVRDGENGYTFENSEQLANKIKSWFEGFPTNVEQNKINLTFKENIKHFFNQKWDDNWDLRAKALFT